MSFGLTKTITIIIATVYNNNTTGHLPGIILGELNLFILLIKS